MEEEQKDPFTSLLFKDRTRTPYYVVKIIREYFNQKNGLTLDPCACKLDREYVGAKISFLPKHDGLNITWYCENIYVFPPPSQTTIWLDKIMREFKSGNCEEIIILLCSADIGANINRMVGVEQIKLRQKIDGDEYILYYLGAHSEDFHKYFRILNII